MKPYPTFWFITLVLAASLCSSCNHYYYCPEIIQTPYSEQPRQLSVSASLGGWPENVHNSNFNVTYNPVNHFTIWANHSRNRTKFQDFLASLSTTTNYTQVVKYNISDLAVGYFGHIGEFKAAIYGGMGIGRSYNNFGINRVAEIDIRRTFLQPTLTYRNSWFIFGLGIRLSALSFPNGQIDHRIEDADIELIKRVESVSPVGFIDLGGNMGFYFKPVSIHANLVLSSLGSIDETFAKRVNIQVGATYDLPEFKKKDNKKAKKKKGKKRG